MSVIEEFVKQYSREFDYFEAIGRFTENRCDTILKSSGIRAIITSRAKRPDRLREKLLKRDARRAYENSADIYADIPDFAGVRIALYFPGDRDKVGSLIGDNFNILETKEFPSSAGDDAGGPYRKRFTGYSATHYRVAFRDDSLPNGDQRYADARIEIQVASVLMHSWSEVEHDLIYKPLSGSVSVDERAILDQINGLVIAGEIALERLQQAVQSRVSGSDEQFSNHFELASYLYNRFGRDENAEPRMGRIDIALRFLQLAGLDKTTLLEPVLADLEVEPSSKPIAELLVDRLLEQKHDLLPLYVVAQEQLGGQNPYHGTDEITGALTNKLLDCFLELENAVTARMAERNQPQALGFPYIQGVRMLHQAGDIPKDLMPRLEMARNLRNSVVHRKFDQRQLFFPSATTIFPGLARWVP